MGREPTRSPAWKFWPTISVVLMVRRLENWKKNHCSTLNRAAFHKQMQNGWSWKVSSTRSCSVFPLKVYAKDSSRQFTISFLCWLENLPVLKLLIHAPLGDCSR